MGNEALTERSRIGTIDEVLAVGDFVRYTGYIPSLNPDDQIQSSVDTIGRVMEIQQGIEWPYITQFVSGEYVACNLFEVTLIKELTKEEELLWSLYIMKN